MRIIKTADIRDKIAQLSQQACIKVDKKITDAFAKSYESEKNPVAKYVFEQLIENYKIAETENIPICQDTGMVTMFVTIGQDVAFKGEAMEKMIQEGIRIGYREGFLRKSIVNDPIERVNTGDNTPAVIHYELVEGDVFNVVIVPKGAGCENMSRIAMLKPADGLPVIEKFVVDAVRDAWANPCPPLFIGVGIGGNFEKVAFLAKKALLLPFDERSETPYIAKLENDLLDEINDLDIGPQGFGGQTTALGVRVLSYPTHIASLPVAVNISCHAMRHIEFSL
ncbi:fumarate hydratase [bacterium]|nr:fumarate hydratase [bacterium]